MVRLGVAFADRAAEGLLVEKVGINLYGGYAVVGGEGLERGTKCVCTPEPLTPSMRQMRTSGSIWFISWADQSCTENKRSNGSTGTSGTVLGRLAAGGSIVAVDTARAMGQQKTTHLAEGMSARY